MALGMIAADVTSVAIYVIAGVLSAILLLVGRRLMRANRADMDTAIDKAVTAAFDRARAEYETRIEGLHRAFDKRLDTVETEIGGVRTKLAAEMGGNNHGLRQAVNELARDVHELTGKFDQYAKDHKS